MSALLLDVRDEGVVEIDDAALQFTTEEHQACLIVDTFVTTYNTGFTVCETC